MLYSRQDMVLGHSRADPGQEQADPAGFDGDSPLFARVLLFLSPATLGMLFGNHIGSILGSMGLSDSQGGLRVAGQREKQAGVGVWRMKWDTRQQKR